LAIVALTAASLGFLAWQRLAVVAVSTGPATIGGMMVNVGSADWIELDHVHDGQGGFVMPNQMLPGAPRGDDVRLGISITIANTGSRLQQFSLVEEFTLVGGSRIQPVTLTGDTFGALPRLAPGAAVKGTLYFDLQPPTENDPPLFLRWIRDGDTVRFPVPLGAPLPGHHA
jgi:hypothetical protein